MFVFSIRIKRQELLIALLLLLWVIFLRLPTFGRPFENDSGAIAYHARLIAQGEPLYGIHHPAHHMPGAYYTYALAFRLFGDTSDSVRLILLLWTAATVFLVYQLGRLVMDRKAGLLTAGLAALLFSHIGLSGLNAKIESFVLLFHVATVLLLFYLLQKESTPWLFSLVGALAGISFLYKVNYVSPLILAGVVWLWQLWQLWQRKRERSIASMFVMPYWIGTGFVTILLPVALYFHNLGLWDRVLLAFTLGQKYIIDTGRPWNLELIILYPLTALTVNNPVLLVAALSGFVFLIRRSLIQLQSITKNSLDPRAAIPRLKNSENAGRLDLMWLIAVWFALAIMETGISRVYFAHYYLMTVTPATLLAVWFLRQLWRDMVTSKPCELLQSRDSILRWTVMLIILTLPVLPSIAQHGAYYYHFYGRYLLGYESYAQFMVAGLPDRQAEYIQRTAELADYVQMHTTPTDTIYNWSDDMHLFYQANRRAPVDIIWPVYASAITSRDHIFEATYIIVGPTTFGYTSLPDWLANGLAENYELEATLQDKYLYRRRR
jgi:4-amino-4-deoxy-L-arabinose transferase-like glycosyltransferase